ncbi:MAG TPA: winged helix-turn-helix domain-containing protein, partial [Candidatus Obscuribacterales bacterium]
MSLVGLTPPGWHGGELGDGKTLSAFIKKRFGINLQVRQRQRVFRQLGFRLRKPRLMISHADPEVQERIKKRVIAELCVGKVAGSAITTGGSVRPDGKSCSSMTSEGFIDDPKALSSGLHGQRCN